jgi:AMIN domain-containing protein
VNGRDLQIALGRAAQSLPLVAVARAARWEFVLPWAMAACLILPLAEAALGASDTPSRPDVAVAQVLGVRSSSQADSGRVVIDLSADVRYKVAHLSNPERVYLDLSQTEISPQLASRRIALEDGLVEQIRMGTGQGSVTRIVLDLRMALRYRVSKLDDPERMLIELSRPSDGMALMESTPIRSAPRAALGQNPSSPRPNSPSTSPQDASSSSSSPGEPRAARPAGPHTYGDAERAGLSYAGTHSPRNILLLGLNGGSSYDDNIFGNNQRRVRDVAFLFGPSLSLRREGRRLSLALNYQPNFRIYRRASEPKAVDQMFEFDAAYQATSRLSFRARASAFYTIGIFQPSQNEPFLPGLGSPSSLNNILFTPGARQLTWSSRIDASYQARAHDSVGLFVGQATLDYRQQVSGLGNLGNTEERQAGLLYQHRISPHTSLGSNYLFEDIRFGSDSRTLVHSAFLSYAQQVSPSLMVSVFGGPQYSRLHEVVILPLGPFRFQIPVFQAGWNWAIGGTLTERLDRTAFELTAQRQVSNGGGLLGAVVGSSVGASVRRRLPGRWDAGGSAGYAINRSLGTFSPGRYQSLTAGAGLGRSLTEKLSVRVGYDFLYQRGSGQSSLFGNLDRDLWSVQLSYQFRQIALGR